MMFNTLLSAAVVVLLAATSTAQQLESGDGMTDIHDHNKSVYYIITDTKNSDQCSVEMCSNLTLSQFASNADYQVSEITTLMLQPGDHHLDSQLLVVSIRKFSLVDERERNDSIVTISCSKSFTFQNVTELHIKGVEFINCTGNHINSVGQLIIDNCTFDGQNHIGSALIIINTTNASITCCLVIHTHGSYKLFLSPYRHIPSIVGGAIISTSSNISTHGCVFERNRAEIGGAIFSEQGSNLTISNCTFRQNVYSSHFGSILLLLIIVQLLY